MSVMRTLATVTAFAAAILSSPISHADQRGWYAGVGYAAISGDSARPDIAFPVDTGNAGSGLLDQQLDSHGYQFLAGFRAFDWLAIEANYIDLGGTEGDLNFVCVVAPCPDRFNNDTTAGSLSILGFYPIGKFDLFARAGFAHWRSREALYSQDELAYAQDVQATDGTYGAGAQFHLGNVTTRFQYERYRFGRDAADLWSLGLTYTFR